MSLLRSICLSLTQVVTPVEAKDLTHAKPTWGVLAVAT